MNSLTFLISGVLLAISVRHVYSIQCYNCIGCNDPFQAGKHEDSKMDCSGSCTKAKAAGGVIRSCLPLLKQDDCTDASDGAACFCPSNLCNGSPATKISVTAILLLSCSFLWKYLF